MVANHYLAARPMLYLVALVATCGLAAAAFQSEQQPRWILYVVSCGECAPPRPRWLAQSIQECWV